MESRSARAPEIFLSIKNMIKNLCAIFFLLLISLKLTILAQFEFCRKMQNPQNGLKYTFFVPFWSILNDFEDFGFFCKIQIELKSSILEILTKEKNCTEIFYHILDRQKILGCARTSARGARALLLSMKTSKIAIFWHAGRIFYGCARAKIFFGIEK